MGGDLRGVILISCGGVCVHQGDGLPERFLFLREDTAGVNDGLLDVLQARSGGTAVFTFILTFDMSGAGFPSIINTH